MQVAEVHGNVAARKQRTDNDEYTRFRVGGYGEAVASFKDYGINRYYGNPNGNTRDHRNTISIPRFVLAMDYKFTPKWILSAEIEFEAGGTGSAMELENSETANMKRKWKRRRSGLGAVSYHPPYSSGFQCAGGTHDCAGGTDQCTS